MKAEDMFIGKMKIRSYINSDAMLLGKDDSNALRVLKRHLFNSDSCMDRDYIEVLKKMRHKNILQPLTIIEIPPYVYAVYDYISAKDLNEYTIKNGKLVEEEVQEVMQQLIAGYKILVDNTLVHGNIKPQNILAVYNADNGKLTVKLADFTIVKSKLPKKGMYVAPEIIAGKTGPTLASDIWSLGAVMKFLSIDIENMSIHTHFYMDLMNRCLEPDPSKRITFREILAHPVIVLDKRILSWDSIVKSIGKEKNNRQRNNDKTIIKFIDGNFSDK